MSETELAEQRVGSVLRGKWTLERLIGVGGMAAVYVARHKIGRLDAIKILHPEFSRVEQIRMRFEQEAHVLNRFKHPGAVEVRDLEKTEDGATFIVMELLDGQSLASRLRSGPKPSVDETLRVADEVLDVLAAAHAQGIIHRDIKPDNLFVLPSGAVKVLDFGIARARTPDGAPLKTKTGTTLGTPAYMPPEQLKGIDIDGRADVYAVGATMFRMLAGKAPHTADTDVELMMKVLMEPAPRIETVVPDVRPDAARIIDRALAFDRDARFPDPRSMQSEIRAARTGAGAAIVAPSAGNADEILTRTPAQLGAGAAVLAAAEAAHLTRASTPESALVRASVPESRHVTRASNDPLPVAAARTGPVALPSQPTRISEIAASAEREVFGIPLVWIIAIGLLVLMVLGAVALGGVVLAMRHDGATPHGATDPSATAAPASTPAQPLDRPADDYRRRKPQKHKDWE